MADRESFAKFLGVSRDEIPQKPDEITRPKETLVNLARSSSLRRIRDDIVPRSGSILRVGPDYNGRLTEFISAHWNPVVTEVNKTVFWFAERERPARRSGPTCCGWAGWAGPTVEPYRIRKLFTAGIGEPIHKAENPQVSLGNTRILGRK